MESLKVIPPFENILLVKAEIFTDQQKNKGYVDIFSSIYSWTEYYKLSEYCSILHAEIGAIRIVAIHIQSQCTIESIHQFKIFLSPFSYTKTLLSKAFFS